MLTAVDCQGFAGGFTLGVVQAGFKLVGKREMRGGFGVANCEAQRHLLGDDWQSEAVSPEAWSVPHGGADLVFGNPPCSGFSVLSTKAFRGEDSKINHCMWALVEYAARCNPEMVIFESVQQTYRQGRSLMTALRARLEELTNQSYHLTHVLHSAYSVGGAALRPRYFWVASRVSFGVEEPMMPHYPVLDEVIGDLEPLDLQWEMQPYRLLPSHWALQLTPHFAYTGGVDGHQVVDNPLTRRIRDIMAGVEWRPREHAQQVVRRYYETYVELPRSWHTTTKLVANDFFMGFNTPVRWSGSQPARVITGAGLLLPLHPHLDRTLTYREVARIMGFPDDWLIEPLRGTPGLQLTWGKGITVQCGRWIGDWARRALEGEPGELVGEPVGNRERLIDVTHAWKRACDTIKTSGKTVNVTENKSQRREHTMTEVAEATASVRGRPRPTVTIERDEAVFAALDEPRTKEQLAELTGLEPKQAYLSLWRLQRDGRVVRTRADGAHVWTRA